MNQNKILLIEDDKEMHTTDKRHVTILIAQTLV